MDGQQKEEANEEKKGHEKNVNKSLIILKHTQWEAAPNTQQIDDTNLTANDHFRLRGCVHFHQISEEEVENFSPIEAPKFSNKENKQQQHEISLNSNLFHL